MTGLQIFHTVIFIIFGIVSLCGARSARKPRKYIDVAAGVIALLVALYDILVSGLGMDVF